MATIRILSAGAARDLLHTVGGDFTATSGAELDMTFGTAGAVRERIENGERFDVIVLTNSLMDALVSGGAVVPESVGDLGAVHSGIAVRGDAPLPDIASADQLKNALLETDAVFCPDTERSTSGAHFMRVITALDIRDVVEPRLTVTPNGAAAMEGLAKSTGRAIGSTQISEILGFPGVTLVGRLPAPFDLATGYAVGVAQGAAEADLAAKLASWLSGRATLEVRAAAGFDAAV